VSALDPVVISVCRISGGTNSNVIPDRVEMEGTTRYLNLELGKEIPILMKRVVKGVCDSMGASYEISYSSPYIPTINHPAIVELGKSIAKHVLGPHGWKDLKDPSMGGEDFSYYITEYPGAMFRIGMGTKYAPLHNARFDFNDHTLKDGILFLTSTALEFLS